MNPETEKTLTFFGKMTANLTHEVKNVLAIIQESAGLMEDITAICPLTEKKYQEKFNRSMATIKQQLHRGIDLTTQFNRFAHTPDRASAELNLVDTVGQFCLLTERFARLKHIGLTAGEPPANERIRLTTNPVQFYMALFFSLESCLTALPADTEIRITPQKKGGKSPAIEYACTGDHLPPAEEFFQQLQAADAWSELREMIGQLQGEVECDTNDLRFWLIF
ncbi:MAG: HAMP domain-containing histidine kinase [Desulfobacterales bacterium]|nr:HAMP domain-containing histidine kinase [Desulfobacterales bacterium]